jgi:acyl-CoA synthetase (AMP-forming)/AMP-acid ligase II
VPSRLNEGEIEMYMTQGLHRAMQQRPHAAAIRYLGRTWTNAQLGARVAKLAGALQRLGVTAGERVAMLSLSSPRFVEYFLAVPWAGAVLNPVNIRWSAAEIVYSLDDSQTSVLIVDETFKAVGAKVAQQAQTIRHLIYAGDGETPAGMLSYEALLAAAEPVEDAHRHGNDLAGIFYTGGTTGFPKGVMLSHTNLGMGALNTVLANDFGPGTTYLHAMPMFHLAGMTATNAVVMGGGTHIIVPLFEPRAVLEAIARERVTNVMFAPTMIQLLLDWRVQNPDAAATLDLSCMERLIYGASPISEKVLSRVREAFPKVRFTQAYGMTETSALATLLTAAWHTEEGAARGKLKSAGQAGVCAEVKIVDAEGREVPRGVVGEIIVRGPGVMLGYWNQPELTAQSVRDGWMHTGDGGYLDDDAFLYVVDRLKDMIVSGGENIYSAEVENAMASHPAVAQCAAIGIPSEKWGETVHAVIVLKPGCMATGEEIQAHCRERIAGYKLPRSVEFREALPLSSVGKVLKTELRKPFWDQHAKGVA